MMFKISFNFLKPFILLTWLLEVSVAAECPIPGITISEQNLSIQFQGPEIAIDNAGNAIAIWTLLNPDIFNNRVQSATFSKGQSWSPPQTINSGSFIPSRPQIAIGHLSGNAVAIWVQQSVLTNQFFLFSSQRPFATGVWSEPVIVSQISGGLPQIAINDSDYAVVIWQYDNGSFTTLRSAELNFGGAWTNIIDVVPSASSNYGEAKIAVDSAGVAYAIWIEQSTTSVQAATLPLNGMAWSSPVNLSLANNQSAPAIAVGNAGFAAATWGATSDFLAYNVEAAVYQSGVWAAAVGISLPQNSLTFPAIAVDYADNAIVLWTDFNVGLVYSAYRTLNTGLWGAPLQVSAGGPFSIGSDVAFDATLPVAVAHAVWNTYNMPGVVIEYATAIGPGPWSSPPCSGIIPNDETSDSPRIAVDPTGFAVIDWLNTSIGAIQATFTPLAPVITSISPSSGSADGGNTVIITGSSFDNATAVYFDGVPISFTLVSATLILVEAPPGIVGSTIPVTVETPVGSALGQYTYVAPICWQL